MDEVCNYSDGGAPIKTIKKKRTNQNFTLKQQLQKEKKKKSLIEQARNLYDKYFNIIKDLELLIDTNDPDYYISRLPDSNTLQKYLKIIYTIMTNELTNDMDELEFNILNDVKKVTIDYRKSNHNAYDITIWIIYVCNILELFYENDLYYNTALEVSNKYDDRKLDNDLTDLFSKTKISNVKPDLSNAYNLKNLTNALNEI